MKGSIAVIIPTAKRLDQLDRTLTSLQSSSGATLQTLVVRNGGQPEASSQRLIARFADINLRVIDEAVPSLLAGRHRGVQESDAETLVFLDDDVEVAPQWAREHSPPTLLTQTFK